MTVNDFFKWLLTLPDYTRELALYDYVETKQELGRELNSEELQEIKNKYTD